MSTSELLEDSLKDPAIADTSRFQWHVTPIGIAALCKEKDTCLSEKIFADAIKEGLVVGLDLSREERESYYSPKGLVILFYS